MRTGRGDGRVTAGCAKSRSVGAVDEFAYFMIRVRRKAGKGSEPDPLSGVVERLGSGEKTEFEGPDQLIRLIANWAVPAMDATATYEVTDL